MALISCPICNHSPVSDQAESCPRCQCSVARFLALSRKMATGAEWGAVWFGSDGSLQMKKGAIHHTREIVDVCGRMVKSLVYDGGNCVCDSEIEQLTAFGAPLERLRIQFGKQLTDATCVHISQLRTLRVIDLQFCYGNISFHGLMQFRHLHQLQLLKLPGLIAAGIRTGLFPKLNGELMALQAALPYVVIDSGQS